MNIHHIKYFIALAKRCNYREAAQFCNVSQPAISMAIKTMEDKLGGHLFDRQRSPICLSPFGVEILDHAEKISAEYERMINYQNDKGPIQGSVTLGIIPTIAPALIPLFIGAFMGRYPKVELRIEEVTTTNIINRINKNELDAGIVATPIDGLKLSYNSMYYEEFVVYSSSEISKEYIIPGDIDIKQLWLLEEGHCIRSQILNLCELKAMENDKILYNAGSIDTLINLVDVQGGVTIVPELYTNQLNTGHKKKLAFFSPPAPAREVSIMYHPYSIKKKLINALQQTIESIIPDDMKNRKNHYNPKIDLHQSPT